MDGDVLPEDVHGFRKLGAELVCLSCCNKFIRTVVRYPSAINMIMV